MKANPSFYKEIILLKKRIISLVLTLFLIVFCFPQSILTAHAANTSGSCGEKLTWSFDKSTGTLTISGQGRMQNWNDPYSTPWYDAKDSITNIIVQSGVTRIGDFAFSGCIHLRQVSFPDSLQEFGVYALAYTGLKTVSIPKGVTQVSMGLFSGCSALEEVIFHDRVEYIGISAFSECSSLKRIDLPVRTDTVCDGAFSKCTALAHVSMPSVFAIPEYCFEQCSALSEVTLCPNLKTIGTWAFRGCKSLKSISLPASTEWIRSGAFNGSGLSSIIIPYGMKVLDDTSVGYSGEGKEYFTIFGYAGTAGEDYAKKNEIRFVALDGTIDAFLDVDKNAFYCDAVGWAVENNVTNGVRPDTFGPNAVCTRAQVVTFLWRAMGSPAPTVQSCPFTDVKESSYYRDAVLWALENEITTGTSPDAFSPEKGCTRAQVVTFLWRAKGKPDPEAEGSAFTDVSERKFYTDAVAWAVKNNITKGMTDTTFAPDSTCTRGQIVTFLYRAVEQ